MVPLPYSYPQSLISALALRRLLPTDHSTCCGLSQATRFRRERKQTLRQDWSRLPSSGVSKARPRAPSKTNE